MLTKSEVGLESKSKWIQSQGCSGSRIRKRKGGNISCVKKSGGNPSLVNKMAIQKEAYEFTVLELRANLQERALPTCGSKNELIMRLMESVP